MTEDNLSEARKKVVALELENDAAVGRIAKLGFDVGNADLAFSQFLMQWVYDNVLSEANREDVDLAWEERRQESLKHLERKARDAAIAADATKLRTPRTPKLIVPGHLRGKGSGGGASGA